MVAANSSFASVIASASPTSQRIRWRPDNRRVLGPYIGCIDATLQPAACNSFKPSIKGDFSEPISKTNPFGFNTASCARIRPDTASGAATTMTSKSTPASVQFPNRAGPSSTVVSATVVANPCDEKKSTNQRPILPAPPIISARLPSPLPSATTRSRSWPSSDDRINICKIFSTRSASTPRSAA